MRNRKVIQTNGSPCPSAVDKEKVMMNTEQYRRNQDRQNHGNIFIQPQDILKQNHQKANQNQPKNQLFINPGADAGDNITPQPPCCRGTTTSAAQIQPRPLAGMVSDATGRFIARLRTISGKASRIHSTVIGRKSLTRTCHRVPLVNLPGEKNDHHDKRRGNPGHPLGKAHIFQQVLDPDKRHHPKLGAGKTLGQDFGVDVKRADFVQQQKIRADTPAHKSAGWSGPDRNPAKTKPVDLTGLSIYACATAIGKIL